jgi:hypothetical protein
VLRLPPHILFFLNHSTASFFISWLCIWNPFDGNLKRNWIILFSLFFLKKIEINTPLSLSLLIETQWQLSAPSSRSFSFYKQQQKSKERIKRYRQTSINNNHNSFSI